MQDVCKSSDFFQKPACGRPGANEGDGCREQLQARKRAPQTTSHNWSQDGDAFMPCVRRGALRQRQDFAQTQGFIPSIPCCEFTQTHATKNTQAALSGFDNNRKFRAKKARPSVGNRTSDRARRNSEAGRRQRHMEDHVYKELELVGSFEKSIEDAIHNAITLASKSLREMKWFEVLQTPVKSKMGLSAIIE